MVPTPLALAILRISPFVLAFSGGLDSRFLAWSATRLAAKGVELHLVHVSGPHVSRKESAQAKAWAETMRLPFTQVPFNPLDTQAVRENGTMRCYHCKHAMFTAIKQAVDRQESLRGRILCDGSNFSDLSLHRPGLAALQELAICSPLAEAKLEKSAIRRVAAATGMDRPDQKARPCLLTRFPYNTPPSLEALDALDKAEEAVEALFAAALARGTLAAMPDFRLRLTAQHNGESARLPFKTELHLDQPLTPLLAAGVVEAATAQGLAAPLVQVSQSVSGFYDKQQNLV